MNEEATPSGSRGTAFERMKAGLLGGGGFVARHSFTGLKHGLKALAYGVTGGFVVLLVIVILYLNSRTDLAVWHEAELEEEFTAGSGIEAFPDYLALEDRLFEELDREVYAKTRVASPEKPGIERYRSGSLSDPRHYEENGNRTFEWKPAGGTAPTAGVLLLHGMSDSPYSLRALGESLHQRGAHVIGLRLPGHGTAPSGLVSFEWEDMDAAVRLAMRHLEAEVGDRPLFLVGYSNGGALSVHYALACLEDDSLPRADGIVLVSPAIGVTPMAALAIWQSRIGNWFGLEKLAWNSILPEYDPYKYVSFAVNAGHQVYRLTTEIADDFDRLSDSGKLDDFPRVLAFQSVVDATVSTPALIDGLFARLPPGSEEHELVLFDINRDEVIESILTDDPTRNVEVIASRPENDFPLTVLTNRGSKEGTLAMRQFRKGRRIGEETATGLAWPAGLYSLSHVSLPFPPDDEFYGEHRPSPGSLRLGMIALRGERGLLQISAADQLRLRWNPFYDHLSSRALEFMGFPEG